MCLRTMKELRGGEVLARDGRIGALDDLYFDREDGQVRYLVVATGVGEHGHLLISSACVAGAPRWRVVLELSRAQVERGAGVWPIEAAARWLDFGRVCSGRRLLGVSVEAEDGLAGRLADLLVDEEHWCIAYLIVDTVGARQVLMPLDWVGGIDLEHGTVQMRRTREELRQSPAL
jgi:hypothetical protein